MVSRLAWGEKLVNLSKDLPIQGVDKSIFSIEGWLIQGVEKSASFNSR